MYHSQDGQDLYLDKHVFKGLKNGIFVDIGANDGITINNTLFFEKVLGWNGLCIEPNDNYFNALSCCFFGKNKISDNKLNVVVSSLFQKTKHCCAHLDEIAC